MKNFIITLNGYGQMLKENFRDISLFEYAVKDNFNSITEKGKWGYIRLGKTFEKAYFSLFAEQSDFPGESFIRSLKYNGFSEKIATLFLGGFLTHVEGKVVETRPRLSDKELYGLLDFVSEGQTKFQFVVNNGESIIGFTKNLPVKNLPFPCSMKNMKFEICLPADREFADINNIINRSSRVLVSHPINNVREDLSEPIANLFWLWGMGKRKHILPFYEKINKKTFYISLDNDLNDLSCLLGFKQVNDISMCEDGSLLWLNNTLDCKENKALWVKRFERFDRDSLNHIRRICAKDECRILFIFDSFTDKDMVLNSEWGIYCVVTNCSSFPFRLKKHIRKSRIFIEDFFKING